MATRRAAVKRPGRSCRPVPSFREGGGRFPSSAIRPKLAASGGVVRLRATVLELLVWLAVAALAAAGLVAGYFAYATRRIAAEAERRVPPAGRFVDIDGNLLHYVDIGEGPPILFLHGLGAQLLQFRHRLFEALPEFRLIAVDRPGSGYSRRGGGDQAARLTRQAAILGRFIAALELERPLVVAHSLGGAVALALALDQPRSISGLALISPLSRYLEPTPPEFRPLYIPSVLKRRLIAHTTAIPAALKLAPQALEFVFSPQSAPPDYMVAGGGWLGLRPSHFEATVADFTMLGQDLPALTARLGEIELPVGVLFGTADRVLDHRLHGLPLKDEIAGIDLELVEGVGHMPHYAAVGTAAAFVRKIARRAFGSA